jgi:hypothetical protein
MILRGGSSSLRSKPCVGTHGFSQVCWNLTHYGVSSWSIFSQPERESASNGIPWIRQQVSGAVQPSVSPMQQPPRTGYRIPGLLE